MQTHIHIYLCRALATTDTPLGRDMSRLAVTPPPATPPVPRTAEGGTTVTDTVLVRGEVVTVMGAILVTSLKMAARSSLVVERTGLFAGGCEGGGAAVLVILVIPVTVVEVMGAGGTSEFGADERVAVELVAFVRETEEEEVASVFV